MIKDIINHICFVIDGSGSMHSLSENVIRVFDSQISKLAQQSKTLNQETRVTVYVFNSDTTCLVYDKDVLRLPSLKSLYVTGGKTALMSATATAIKELEQTAQLHGDHAFLIYVITDGEENASRGITAATLTERIKLLPENWTLAALVPNQVGVHDAKKFGFPANNIAVWTATGAGMDDAGDVVSSATQSFMTSRSTGTRGTKTLFSLDTTGLSRTVVKSSLDAIPPTSFMVLPVAREGAAIKDFVESWTKVPYVVGSTYHQLVKPETVQPYKQICIQEKLTGKVYSGDNARNLIGLPTGTTVKVCPANNTVFNIFLQSTSVNRKLVAGTNVIVFK